MIVVTGASGFIGSNLVRRLMEMGEKNILCVDYEYRYEYFKNLPVLFTPADEFYKHTKNYKGINAIFHEGAISSTTETDVKKLYKYNIECTWNLIYYCRDNNIPLQYASSASVYGNPSIKEWNNPDKPLRPLNEYARSKTQIDYVVDLIINSKKPPKLLQGMRYFNVYGPNEDHKGDQASPYHKFKKQLEKTGKIQLFEGSKDFYRDFISVDEVIDKKIITLLDKKSGIYDVGTGKPKSFYDVAIEICGSPDLIEWMPMPDNLKEHYQTYSCAIMDHSNL
jgi:ADP-L-glycero-D-manno-heptose 6-epimerase